MSAQRLIMSSKVSGGQGGIRTHGELAPSAVFKTAAFDHSATCPLGDAISQFYSVMQKLSDNNVKIMKIVEYSGHSLMLPIAEC